jgi:cation diffusion facilitator CzcD-associated flavoprotein CzcO
MYDREGGHFFDTSAGKYIANGTVKVVCKALPTEYTATGLAMSDGTHLDADVIVFATGYTGNMRDTAKKIFGDEVGNGLEEFWQCDEEGESRGAWKFTGRK